MGTRDKRVDAYIAKSAEFARPILTHLRSVVHAACPEAEETMKWSFPHFDYRGQILCSMAAFTQHAAFGFWKGTQVVGERAVSREAMGSFGRLTAIADLPPKRELVAFIRKAMALADAGVTAARPAKRTKPALRMPSDLGAALRKTAGAQKHWKAFPPSHRSEYLEWILGAKQAATRARRIATTVAQVAEGKSQHWKYERRPD